MSRSRFEGLKSVLFACVWRVADFPLARGKSAQVSIVCMERGLL